MSEAVATKNLASALVAVMSEVGSLEKDGTNDFSNYSFTTETMVVNTIRPLFVKHGLALIPHNISMVSSEELGKMRRVMISATYLLMHESGESTTVTVPGEGMDSLDKSTNKALTAAFKYALLQMTLAGRGDDGDEGKGYAVAADAQTVGAVPFAAMVRENAAVRAAAASNYDPAPPGFIFKFGKHKGDSITTVPKDYLDWLVKKTEGDLLDASKKSYAGANKQMLDAILSEFSRRARNAVPDEDLPFAPGEEPY